MGEVNFNQMFGSKETYIKNVTSNGFMFAVVLKNFSKYEPSAETNRNQ